MILKDAVLQAQNKYFSGAVTDSDYMNGVMAYYKENLNLFRLSMGGLQQELGAITNKYNDYTDDAHVIEWANEIKRLFVKKKAVKNPNFNPIEYLAVNYIAGSHGSAGWAKL